jgi:hypothetical protein
VRLKVVAHYCGPNGLAHLGHLLGALTLTLSQV